MSKSDIVDILKQRIEHFEKEVVFTEIGTVREVRDGVMVISGLKNVSMGEMVEVKTPKGPVYAVALNLEESQIGAVALGEYTHVVEGDEVRGLGRVLSVPVSEKLVGRVVNPLGIPVDGKGEILVESRPASTQRGEKFVKSEGEEKPPLNLPLRKGETTEGVEYAPVEKIALGVIERASVNQPLHTGIMAIDGMIPIGRGQRELIIGDRQTGKTAIAIDAIIHQQHEKPIICIYVAIGQKESKIAKIVAELEARGAMKYTIVVVAGAADPASLQYIAPYAGCAMGEYFMGKGQDALVVYDDLSKHANAYREISLLLKRPSGREAFPGDVFYLHSRLLERSAKLSKENGGGSLTALPIIETQAGDVSAYIPTNVISITDGQIYLEPDLFFQGIRPAVNAGLSVSRVGSTAQIKAMKKVAGKLRLELAQFRELAAFAQFGSDLDTETQKRIERGKRLQELLKQSQYETRPVEEQVVVLYAVTNGFADSILVEGIKAWEQKLLEYVKGSSKVLDEIREKKEMAEGIENHLKSALEAFVKLER